MKKETEQFYEIVKKAVENEFKDRYSVDFEITAEKRGWIPKKFIKNKVLLNHRLPTPDVMGFIWKEGEKQKKKLVIVEFKLEPKFRDIFQVKGYNELFDSDYTFLVSQKPFYESSKKVLHFVKEKPELIRAKDGKSHIIRFLHKTSEGKITLARLGPDLNIFP